MKWSIVIISLLIAACGKNPDVRTLWHNHESIKLLSNKNPEGSQKELIEALRFDPFQSEVHLNLGLNLEILKENDKALKQYVAAEKYSENPFHFFIARFNRAQLLARDKKIEEALSEYQKALEIVPTSKEVKTNIELLAQQSQGQGQGKSDQEQKDKKDSQDKSDGSGNDQKENEDQNSKEKKPDQKKEYQSNQKYQPREFKGELSPGDIKKILDELKQQEQKIRAEYNKKNDYKERPRDKDW